MSGIHRPRPLPIEDADLQTGEAIFTTAGDPPRVHAAFGPTSAQGRLPERVRGWRLWQAHRAERVEQPGERDEIDDAEEIGDDLPAVGLAAVMARSTVAPYGGRLTACRGRVVAGNTPPPGGPYDTHATNGLTRRPAWACWVIPQDPVCPAHPPRRLRRAHHQQADRGHARDADLDRNRPSGTAPIRPRTPARGLGPVAGVASAYVIAVRTTAASRCRRIAWREVAGSTPRL
jgi:hypothetical protein